MIYTKFNKPPAKKTPAGTHFIKTYQEEINKKGEINLVYKGLHDIYSEIQLDLESSKVENILHQVAMGDLRALQQREATYVDATTMPKNLQEAQNLVLRMKDEFFKMPLEVRKEFDNSPEKYVSLMGTNEYKEIMAPYNNKIAAIAKEKSDKEYREKVMSGAQLNIDIEKETAKLKGEKA